MRWIISILLYINFFTAGYTQIIKGIILDKNTDSPINFASVYINGTFVGTHSDRNGHFELDISKNISMPIIISSLGYYSFTLTDYSPDKLYKVYLEPKIFELREVVITAKGYTRGRKVNLKLFKNEFLGKTLNARMCEITNEEDIILTYDSDNDTLKAFSSKPILIENKALGYSISYYLDKFEYCKKDNFFVLSGNSIFREDSTIQEIQKQRFERRRKSAYLGSRMHFFRALWENNLDSAGFTIKDSENVKLNYNNIVIETDSLVNKDRTKYLKYPGNLFITYFTKSGGSIIAFINESIYFDKNGYFYGLGILWDGEMIRQRVADMLPYEYSIK